MKKLLAGLGVVLLLGVLGWWVARPAYRNWQQNRLVAQAQAALGRKDYRSAGLSARQTLQINAANVEACRIMARITEAIHSPEALAKALEWRQRIVELAPDALSNRLELARCGILQGQYAVAARALQGVPPAQQNNVAFHQMAAMVAISLNHIAEAEQHITEAARLDPGRNLLKLNQAIIHLQAKDQRVVAGAIKSLEQLSTDPEYGRDALRHLAMAAWRNKDFGKAVAFTEHLQADPKATLGDRLMHLAVLKEAANGDFKAYLTQLEEDCARDADRANTLAAWLVGHAQADEAVRWLNTLPAERQTQPAVVLAKAEGLMALERWQELQILLQDVKWEHADFIRQAMLARAYRGQRQDFTAQTEWRAAVRAVSDRPKQLGMLARLAHEWGWKADQEEVLWLIVERFPGERWALQTLNESYLASGNTRGLYKVYSALVEFNPDDFAAKNNLAAISLLLNLQPAKAHELARESWLKATNNAAFASTYAWSLHLQGRTGEGIKVLESLKSDRLKIPAVALYYGAMEAAMNEPGKARKYLDLAATGKLLPEEKTLLDDARNRL